MIRARGSGWWLSATLLLTSVLMRKPPGRETQPQWAALRANYDDRYITVGEHFDCFATEHDRRDAAAAMGGHHNCVASSLSRRIDNRLVGVLVFNLHHIAGHASRRGSILRRLEIFPGKSGNTFFVLVRRVRHMTGSTAKIWKGSDTVTAVTLALRAFASPIPWSTALFDNSDPSVGIRICLYILHLPQIS